MESLPFGSGVSRNAMGMPVAFSNAIGLDLSGVRRLVWVSGQIAVNEQDQLVGAGDIRAQTEQCLINIRRQLDQLGASLQNVVQVTVFVRDMADLQAIHEVRLRYFTPPYPTSTLVAVSGFVHPDAMIEINAVAAVHH
jgi:2-iminobutanoate/2-iminopropanoate deaminase